MRRLYFNQRLLYELIKGKKELGKRWKEMDKVVINNAKTREGEVVGARWNQNKIQDTKFLKIISRININSYFPSYFPI